MEQHDRFRFAAMMRGAYPNASPAAGYGNFAVSSGSAYGNGSAHEWCSGCGRKLAWDGRCERCDAWWASPLVQAGAPCVAAAMIFLAFLIGTLRSSSSSGAGGSAPAAGATLLAAPAAPVFAPQAAIRAPLARPLGAPPTAPAPPFVISSLPTTDPAAPSPALMELERLRDLTRSVDAAVAADASAGATFAQPSSGPKALALPVSRFDE